MWGPADRLAFFDALGVRPYAFDFFQALRRIECLHPELPKIGKAVRPSQEAVRLGQEPSLDFAPAAISGFYPATGKRPARLEVRFLGLLGPNGPLPLHLTEYARERMHHARDREHPHGDETFARFLDVFNHRFLTLFYRAWAQAQPTLSLDRPTEDRFSSYIGSTFGIGSPGVRDREALPDAAKLFFAGVLSRNARQRDGLQAVLATYFRVPCR